MKRILIALTTLTLSACATPPLTFSVSEVTRATHKHDGALVSTIVTMAPNGQAKSSIGVLGKEADVAQMWKASLDDALLRSYAFDDDSRKKLTLSVKIVQLGHGALGLGVDAIAKYELVDRSNGNILFSKEIATRGTAKDYYGDNRVRNAASRAVSQNISQFISMISEAAF